MLHGMGLGIQKQSLFITRPARSRSQSPCGCFGFVGEEGFGEREKTGQEPFALHPPIQWAIWGYDSAEKGLIGN